MSKKINKISTSNKFKGNPRIITTKQFDHLKEHLQDLGDLGGVVYCHQNECFVGGNQRSTVFDGAEIEIIESFKKPTKCGTVAHGFIVYKGEKYSYREVVFSKDDFDKACIVANNDGGSFDWDQLANEWDSEQLNEWGLDVWQAPEDVDYSILDDEDEADSQLEDMAGGVKKAIQIEFEPEHYEDAAAIVKYWRERDAYVGKMILDFLTDERGK